MRNFEYYAPTRVVFGREAELQVPSLIKEQGAGKVLIHYGGRSAKKSGLLDRIINSLTEAGIPYVCLGGVVPNPRLDKVYEGIALCREEGVDFILAVGGGSVIDSAKAIGYGLSNDCDVWDFFERRQTAKGCVPLGAVLTIAAAGSEMSDSCVITNEKTWTKRGYSNDCSRCKFAVLNPELTYSLPSFQTSCGCVDILMHTMERYFSREKNAEVTDSMAEGLMRTVIHNAKILQRDPKNYDARAEIMWASSLSHNGLTGCGLSGDWAVHQLGHELSGIFDIAHGAALAAVWGSWARYVYQEDASRFAQFAVNVMGMPNRFAAPEQTALEGIEALEEFYHSIGMPTSVSEMELDLSDEQLRQLAFRCSFENTRTIGGFKTLDLEDMENIYRMAK